MAKRVERYSRKAGLPPGSLVYVGVERSEKPSISVIDYDETGQRERAVKSVEDCRAYLSSNTVTWINLTGLNDTSLLEAFGDVFDIHPLVLEDIATTGQRPRMEDHDTCIYIVLNMLYRGAEDHEIVAEQISLLLYENAVVSFQETDGDVFDVIRERIRLGKGRILKAHADYLAYSLIDAIVDNYFVVLEGLSDRIESVQDAVLADPDPALLQAIHELKRELVFIRKTVWPLRELIGGLEKTDSPLVRKPTSPYLRDLYEHAIHVIDTVETLRDMLAGALDIYMTSVSNRMNEVMKVLTVIATIFIPLTFVAGVYGMNFDVMPELRWHYGYAAVWAIMLAIGIGMAIVFKRRKWF